MTEYVTTADALFFHKLLIDRYGGAHGIRDAGALESALHRPQTTPDIHEEMIRLIETQSFDMEHLVPWLQAIVV